MSSPLTRSVCTSAELGAAGRPGQATKGKESSTARTQHPQGSVTPESWGHVTVRGLMGHTVRRCCWAATGHTNKPSKLCSQLCPASPLPATCGHSKPHPNQELTIPQAPLHVPTSAPWLGYLLALNAAVLLFTYHKTPCSSRSRSNVTFLMLSLSRLPPSLSSCLLFLSALSFQSELFMTLLPHLHYNYINIILLVNMSYAPNEGHTLL